MAVARLLVQDNLPDVDLPMEMGAPDIYGLDEDDVLLLASFGQETVGMLYGHAPPAGDQAGHLTLLAVAEPHRRQGVGRRLIREYVAVAARAGTERIWLDVPEGPNERRLLAYYSRLGWTDRTGYLDGKADHRWEQMYGTVQSVQAALGEA
jgi:ribosomal protein S18 acetylase RimI-like enzyme